MKVNVKSGVVETPEKVDPGNQESPDKLDNLPVRLFYPGPFMKGLSKTLEKNHSFCHDADIKPIEDMRLDLKLKDEIRELFTGFDQDLSDWMLRMEEIQTERGTFSSFTRDFIHYQFGVQKENAFAVLLVLNHIIKFKSSPADAFSEVFQLSTENIEFGECYEMDKGQKTPQKQLFVSSKVVADESDEFDDDVVDPDFVSEKISRIVVTSSEDSSEPFDNCFGRNKFASENKCAFKSYETNPFAISDEEDVFEFKEQAPLVNPFEISDEYSRTSKERDCQFVPKKTSSAKLESSKGAMQCEYCKKKFSSCYNLKLHNVQVHRIFPDDMKIFECPECEFVTGSRICYTRHATTHLRKSNKKKLTSHKMTCNYCGTVVSNKSSLKRHISRKHGTE